MMISEDVVQRALDEASEYSPAKATSVVKATAEAQPELFAFVVELTEDLSEETMSLALMMLVTILRAYEIGSTQPVREIDRRAMTRAFRKNETMLETILQSPEAKLLDAVPKAFRQPHLMRFVVETVMEDEDQFTPEESGTLFLVLKTAIDALDTAAKPQRHRPKLAVVKGKD